MLDTMRENAVHPNVYRYNTAIKACANGGAWKLALDLLPRMQEKGVVPDVVSYSTAMKAC